jgi:hypothetical protein
MTPTPSQEPVASERERFEAAWVKRGLLHPSRSSEPGYTDQYESPIAQNGWVMWQARAALSAPPAQALHASNPQILKAYELGFLRAAEWARRDDLRADLDSGAYAKDRARDLGPMLAPPTPQAAPVAAEGDEREQFEACIERLGSVAAKEEEVRIASVALAGVVENDSNKVPAEKGFLSSMADFVDSVDAMVLRRGSGNLHPTDDPDRFVFKRTMPFAADSSRIELGAKAIHAARRELSAVQDGNSQFNVDWAVLPEDFKNIDRKLAKACLAAAA